MHTVFLNWGLTEDSLKKMPPALQRSFSRDVFEGNVDGIYRGLGSEMGEGRGGILMKGSWNAELYDGLRKVYEKGGEKVDSVEKVSFFDQDAARSLLPSTDLLLLFRDSGSTIRSLGKWYSLRALPPGERDHNALLRRSQLKSSELCFLSFPPPNSLLLVPSS